MATKEKFAENNLSNSLTDYKLLNRKKQDLTIRRHEIKEESRLVREQQREIKQETIRSLAESFSRAMSNSDNRNAYEFNMFMHKFLNYVNRKCAVSPEHRKAQDEFKRAWHKMNKIFADFAAENPDKFADIMSRQSGFKNLY